MTDPQLQKLLKLWQKRLRLQDWQLQAKLVPVVLIEHDASCSGSTTCKPSFMLAEIEIKDSLDDEELEITLVHELLHVRFGGMQPPEGLHDFLFETGIEMTARALVEAYN